MNNRSQDMGKTALTVLLTVVLASFTIAPLVFAAGGNDEAIWEAWTSESYTFTVEVSF